MAYVYEAGKFSRERVFAVDGMAVTAEIWNAAHDYHRQMLSASIRAVQGNGIIEGLHVYAATPANPQSIHIDPGVAVDNLGRIIVNPELLTHNLRDQIGLVYLILMADEESITPSRANDQSDGSPKHKRSEFFVRALTELPTEPYVELARIRRNDISLAIKNATDAEQAGAQEIDLRFRTRLQTAQSTPLALGLVSLDRDMAAQHWQGWVHLTRELRNTGVCNAWVQRNVPLDKDLSIYSLLCMSGQRNFSLNEMERHHLYQYIQNGGVVYFESCRRDLRFGEPGSDKSFLDLVQWMGGTFTEISSNHALYTIPHIFMRLPEAYENRGTPTLQIASGIGKGIVIQSKNDYACLWNGDRRDRNATRTEMREAFEWGNNLLQFARQYRQNL